MLLVSRLCTLGREPGNLILVLERNCWNGILHQYIIFSKVTSAHDYILFRVNMMNIHRKRNNLGYVYMYWVSHIRHAASFSPCSDRGRHWEWILCIYICIKRELGWPAVPNELTVMSWNGSSVVILQASEPAGAG